MYPQYNGYEKGHKQLKILQKRRKRTPLKNAVFVRQVVLFSTDSVPMKKNWKEQNGIGTNVLGRTRRVRAVPEGRQAELNGALLRSKIKRGRTLSR